MGDTTVSTLALQLTGDASGVSSAFRAATAEGKRYEKALGSITYVGKQMASAGKIMAIGITLPLVLAGRAAKDLGMAAMDAQGLFGKAFEGMEADANAWAATFSRTMKINKYELMAEVAGVQLLGRNLGLTASQAFTMAKGLAETSRNLAAMLDKDTGAVLEALKKGLGGSYKGLKEYNIVIDAAAVKGYAWSHGLAAQGQALTTTQEALAAYALIMEQAAVSTGAWAEELKDPEGRIRSMGDAFKEAGASAGLIILPVLANLADMLSSVAYAFSALPPGAQKAIVAFLATAAVIGPLLLITAKGIEVFKTLGVTKAVLGRVFGRALLSTVADTGATVLNTAAMTANTAAVGLNTTTQWMAAGATSASKAGFGDLAKVLAGASKGITVSEHATTKFAGALGGSGGLGSAFSSLSGFLGPLLLPLGALAAVFGVIYLATKKWGGGVTELADSTEKFRRVAQVSNETTATGTVLVRDATAAARGYAEQLGVLEAASGSAAPAVEKLTNTFWLGKRGNRNASDFARPIIETPTPPDGGLPPGPFDLLATELAIVRQEWELYAASTDALDGAWAFETREAANLAKQMGVLEKSIAAVEAAKRKDGDATGELTLKLLSLQTELAEATKEYEAAKATMSATPAETSRLMLYLGEQAGEAGTTIGARMEWAISEYIRRYGLEDTPENRAKAKEALNVPGLGDGGRVMSSGLIEVGERGREVIPLAAGTVVSQGDAEGPQEIAISIVNNFGAGVRPSDARVYADAMVNRLAAATRARRLGGVLT